MSDLLWLGGVALASLVGYVLGYDHGAATMWALCRERCRQREEWRRRGRCRAAGRACAVPTRTDPGAAPWN